MWNLDHLKFTLSWCCLLAGGPAEGVGQNTHTWCLFVAWASSQHGFVEREHSKNCLLWPVSEVMQHHLCCVLLIKAVIQIFLQFQCTDPTSQWKKCYHHMVRTCGMGYVLPWPSLENIICCKQGKSFRMFPAAESFRLLYPLF